MKTFTEVNWFTIYDFLMRKDIPSGEIPDSVNDMYSKFPAEMEELESIIKAQLAKNV